MPDSHCVPRAAVGAWFGPGLRGGGPKRKKVQEDTLSLQQHRPWAHPSVASPEPRPRRPRAPLLSELLSPHPRATVSSPGTGTQPWGIRALVIPASATWASPPPKQHCWDCDQLGHTHSCALGTARWPFLASGHWEP